MTWWRLGSNCSYQVSWKNNKRTTRLLRLMVSDGAEGREEGRWREPCTRCPLYAETKNYPALQTVSCCGNWHSGGCQYSQSDRNKCLSKWYLDGCRRMAPKLTFASDTPFPRHTSTSWQGWLKKCGGIGLVFVHDRYSHARNCIGPLSNTGLFSFHCFLVSFPPSTPLDSWSQLLFQFSRV